jgi:hypothetical protein
MSVLIDPPLWPAHGRLWSHLVSDTSLEELHAFARAAGVPERGFEGDHYDVPDQSYEDLVRAGAQPVGTRELLQRLQLSGLRRPKRRGERVLSSVSDRWGLRVDAVRSGLAPPTLPGAAWIVLQSAGTFLAGAADGRLPQVAVSGDDVSSGASWLDAAAPAAMPATAELARWGYLRRYLGEADRRGPYEFESVLHHRLGATPGHPRQGGVPSEGQQRWAWRAAEDVVLAQPVELRPLLVLLIGGAGAA